MPFSRIAFLTSSPPVTRVSLFASAISFFAEIASSVGLKPAIPTIALTTTSLSLSFAHSSMPSFPPRTFISVSARLFFNSKYLF